MHCLLFLTLLAVTLAAMAFDSLLVRRQDPNRCEMTYMRPQYIPVNMAPNHTRFLRKYQLYLYRESIYDSLVNEFSGVPVLFVPGNRGSFKQIRSIASTAAVTLHAEYQKLQPGGKLSKIPFDFFSVDFNEEFSGVHGGTLLEQSEYLNDVIWFLLNVYYPDQRTRLSRTGPLPSAVILIGHSMGGFVARTIFTLDNYVRKSVNTILTLSTPHVGPKAPIDRSLFKVYSEVNRFWREELQLAASRPDSPGVLADMALLSIAGGNADTLVHSELSDISSIIPETHGMNALTTSMPNVWLSADHQCILWCNQVVQMVSAALFRIQQADRPSQTVPRKERISIFRHMFSAGNHTTILADNLESSAEKIIDIDLASITSKDSVRWMNADELTIVTPPSRSQAVSENLVYVFSLSKLQSRGVTRFKLLTSLPANDAMNPVKVYGCTGRYHSSETLNNCQRLDQDRFRSFPVSDRSLLLSLELDHLEFMPRFEQMIILASTGNYYSTAQFMYPNYHELVVEPSWLNLVLGGHTKSLVESYSAAYRLHFPHLTNHLLMYHFQITPTICPKPLHSLLIRQYAPATGELKHWDGSTAFYLSFIGSSSKSASGVQLDLWVDPNCGIQSVSISIDYYGTLGQMVKYYSSLGVVIPVVVLLWILAIQFETFWSSTDTQRRRFPGFTETLARFTSDYLGKLTGVIFLLGMLEWLDLPISPSFTNNLEVLEHPGMPWTWFLLAACLPISVGIINCANCLVGMVVKILTAFAAVVYNKVRLLDRRQSPGRWREVKIITLIILLWLVKTVIPYHFAYMVAFTAQILTLIHTNMLQKRCRNGRHNEKKYDDGDKDGLVGDESDLRNQSNYQYSILLLMATLILFVVPRLLVWANNLTIFWVSASDHDILDVLPFIIFSAFFSLRPPVPAARFVGILRVLTRVFIAVLIAYAVCYGNQHTFVLYTVVGISLFSYLSALNVINLYGADLAKRWSLAFTASRLNKD